MSLPVPIPEKHDGDLAGRSSVRLWLRLLSCAMTIEKFVQRRLADRYETTLPRFDVMAALERKPEGMTMSELSRALLASNGNVTSIVQKLAGEGHVSVATSPADRRASIVHLTEVGRLHFDEIARAHHDWIDGLLAGLSGRERERLYEALAPLKRSLGEAVCKVSL